MANQRQELFYGLIRIHVLAHASQEPIFGLAMQEELRHHGYRIGPGTLYPLLHGLERAGLLRSRTEDRTGGGRRRTYTITAAGRRALDRARTKVDELHHELHEDRPRMRLGSMKPERAAKIIPTAEPPGVREQAAEAPKIDRNGRRRGSRRTSLEKGHERA